MPIRVHADVRPISEDVFKQIAYAVTRVAFDMHNEYGINLGAMSVEHEFVSTTLTPADRKRLTIHRDRWRATGSQRVKFCELLLALLNDWGAFLQLPLYYDGLMHFFGGPDEVIRDIPVIREGREVTRQKVHLLDPQTAFKLTAVDSQLGMIEEHLRRFLHHTKLQAIQWVNLHQHDVIFTTLTQSQNIPAP